MQKIISTIFIIFFASLISACSPDVDFNFNEAVDVNFNQPVNFNNAEPSGEPTKAPVMADPTIIPSPSPEASPKKEPTRAVPTHTPVEPDGSLPAFHLVTIREQGEPSEITGALGQIYNVVKSEYRVGKYSELAGHRTIGKKTPQLALARLTAEIDVRLPLETEQSVPWTLFVQVPDNTLSIEECEEVNLVWDEVKYEKIVNMSPISGASGLASIQRTIHQLCPFNSDVNFADLSTRIETMSDQSNTTDYQVDYVLIPETETTSQLYIFIPRDPNPGGGATVREQACLAMGCDPNSWSGWICWARGC